MNAKYYPAMKQHAEYAQKVICINPDIKTKKYNKPSDLLVSVFNVLCDEYSIDDKDFALEVSKQIFYGYYIEVNSYYAKQ